MLSIIYKSLILFSPSRAIEIKESVPSDNRVVDASAICRITTSEMAKVHKISMIVRVLVSLDRGG